MTDLLQELNYVLDNYNRRIHSNLDAQEIAMFLDNHADEFRDLLKSKSSKKIDLSDKHLENNIQYLKIGDKGRLTHGNNNVVIQEAVVIKVSAGVGDVWGFQNVKTGDKMFTSEGFTFWNSNEDKISASEEWIPKPPDLSTVGEVDIKLKNGAVFLNCTLSCRKFYWEESGKPMTYFRYKDVAYYRPSTRKGE